MDHFLTCSSYENIAQEHNWKAILENNTEIQFEIAKIVRKRQQYRKHINDTYMRLVILKFHLTPGLQATVEQCFVILYICKTFLDFYWLIRRLMQNSFWNVLSRLLNKILSMKINCVERKKLGRDPNILLIFDLIQFSKLFCIAYQH